MYYTLSYVLLSCVSVVGTNRDGIIHDNTGFICSKRFRKKFLGICEDRKIRFLVLML